MSIILESQESSSPIITKAVANGLLQKPSEVYHFSAFQRIMLHMIGHLPSRVAEWVIPRANSGNVLSGDDLKELKTSELVNGRIADYNNIPGQFPTITLGVGMGGTTAHLALSLGGPFLPQAFVLTLKNGTMTGNVNEYNQLTMPLAKEITRRNSDLMSIQHYDPVHDGWLVRRVNHLRLKLIDLPDEYKGFIKKKLQPGGDVVYLEGKATWKRFRTGERNTFQIGGWGDISADEFINGSPRLTTFARKEKLSFDHWALDGFPQEEGAESEWGSEPGFGEALEKFCNTEGYHFHKISFSDPNDFSRLAFKAKRYILEKQGIKPSGSVVEVFSQYDAHIVDQTALLPLWLIFNTMDSCDFLDQMKEEFPKGLPVFFSSLATFSLTPDIVPWDKWEEVLNGFDTVNIGCRKTHYPADTLALLNWKRPLERWAKNNQVKKVLRIQAKELDQLAKLLAN